MAFRRVAKVGGAAVLAAVAAAVGYAVWAIRTEETDPYGTDGPRGGIGVTRH